MPASMPAARPFHAACRGVLCGLLLVAASAAFATEVDLVVPPALAAGDEAGYAVAIDAQRIAVGAPGADGGSGAVMVYDCSVQSCVLQQRLAPAPLRPGAAFGFSVALAGDVLAVGLPQQGVGVVQVFRRTGGSWTLERELVPPSGVAGDRYGGALSASPGRIAVAAPRADGGSGKVYVHTESGGAWAQEQVLAAPASGGQFGSALALDGASLLIGAPLLPGVAAGSYARGAAYVYVASSRGWSLQASLRPAAATDGDGFGHAVALQADLAVIGAPRRAALRGSGFVFRRSGTVWTEQAELVVAAALPGDGYGWSVGVGAGRAALGAPFAAADPGGNCGRVRFFDGPGPWRENPFGDVARPQFGELTGWSVAASGERWLVGAPGRVVSALGHYGGAYRFDPDLRLFADGFETPPDPCADG